MRTTLVTLAILSAAVLMIPGLAYGESASDVSGRAGDLKAPPARPLPLTAAQYDGLQRVQAEPEHTRVLDAAATYSPREKQLQWTRFSDDVWTAVYQVGWPGAYLAVLLCAL